MTAAASETATRPTRVRTSIKSAWGLFGTVAIGVTAYLGFEPLFDRITSGVAAGAIGAAFSALFVIFATNFLLGRQTEAQANLQNEQTIAQQNFQSDLTRRDQEFQRGLFEQQSKEQQLRAQLDEQFREKIFVFKEIVKEISEVFKDGQISISELRDLETNFLKLQLVAQGSTIHEYVKFYNTSVKQFRDLAQKDREEPNSEGDDQGSDAITVRLNTEAKSECLKSAILFAQSCRSELNLSGSDITYDLMDSIEGVLQDSADMETEVIAKFKRQYFDSTEEWANYAKSKGVGDESIELLRRLAKYGESDLNYNVSITRAHVSYKLKGATSKIKVVAYLNFQSPTGIRISIRLRNVTQSQKDTLSNLAPNGEFVNDPREESGWFKFCVQSTNEEDLRLIREVCKIGETAIGRETNG